MNEEILQLLGLLRLEHTSTLTIPIAANNEYGVPIGVKGACKALVFRLNNFVRNSTVPTAITPAYFYYGDRQRQEYEVLRGVNSGIFFCQDISEAAVRCPFNTEVNIQVMIYT